jgi:hypothetical protein
MFSIPRTLFYSILAGLLLTPPPAFAESKQPAADEKAADALFAQSFVGRTYDDELDIDGWTDLGGGLVAPPIYVHEYEREQDGTFLVLTSMETAKESGDKPASYEVTDALIVSKVQKDAALSVSCVQGDDETLNFIAEAKGKDDKEWWSDVRRAWEISLETGKIASISPKGIRCNNPGW